MRKYIKKYESFKEDEDEEILDDQNGDVEDQEEDEQDEEGQEQDPDEEIVPEEELIERKISLLEARRSFAAGIVLESDKIGDLEAHNKMVDEIFKINKEIEKLKQQKREIRKKMKKS